MSDTSNANREYKNSLFTDYFNDKERLIDAYNALSGTSFPSDADVQIETLANVLYSGLYNDIAFSIEGRYVVLIEHQSTLNENMPLRFLLYLAHVYEAMIDSRKLYKTHVHKIPAPQFFVIYNGPATAPDRQLMRLSDAFIETEAAPALELTCEVYNVACGHNAELLAKSRSLGDYATFVAMVEDMRKADVSLEDAIKASILRCRRDGIMATYLENRGSEVLSMLLTEWNNEDWFEVVREEAQEFGRAEGLAEGAEERAELQAQFDATVRRMKAAGMDTADICQFTGLTPDDVARL
jgi:predicted transposase YdaD